MFTHKVCFIKGHYNKAFGMFIDMRINETLRSPYYNKYQIMPYKFVPFDSRTLN